MVMLDEPMAGVNPALTQSLLGHVKDLRDEGMTVMFVEHDMDVVHDISDWVVVMAEGRIIAEGTPDADQHQPGGDRRLPRRPPRRAAHRRRRRQRAAGRGRGRRSQRGARTTDELTTPTLPSRRARARGRRRAHDWDGPAARRPTTSSPATCPGSTSSTAATLELARPASWSASSARTAPASRRCSRRCSGSSRSRSGTVTLARRGHHRAEGPRPRRRWASATCPQNNNVFPQPHRRGEPRDGRSTSAPSDFGERFEEVCELFPLLGERRKQRAGSLSGGERQMVAMGRALMMRPVGAAARRAVGRPVAGLPGRGVHPLPADQRRPACRS